MKPYARTAEPVRTRSTGSHGDLTMTTCTRTRTGSLIVLVSLLLIALLVVGGVGAADISTAEAALPMKTISKSPLTEELTAKTFADFSKRAFVYSEASVDSAKIEKDLISVVSTAKPRESGGITVELFCQDNMNYFMPVWGGSITKDKQAWEFSPKDAMRKEIDGCYFAIVDSTAEMVTK